VLLVDLFILSFRLKENLSNLESENQVLRQQALVMSTTRDFSGDIKTSVSLIASHIISFWFSFLYFLIHEMLCMQLFIYILLFKIAYVPCIANVFLYFHSYVFWSHLFRLWFRLEEKVADLESQNQALRQQQIVVVPTPREIKASVLEVFLPLSENLTTDNNGVFYILIYFGVIFVYLDWFCCEFLLFQKSLENGHPVNMGSIDAEVSCLIV